jgi:hypothetical protein
MPQSIIAINATHQDPFNTSRYTFNFPSTRDVTGAKIGLKSVAIYNSWNTIDPQYNNQQFNIIFPAGAGDTTLAITIPAGIYSVADLNNYLRSYFISQSLYLSNNTTGDITVYAEFQLNSTAYSIDFVSFPIPTTTPSGFTNAGITLPTVSRGPQIVVIDNGFATLLGYTPGTYPAAQQATVYTKQSDVIPVISPVQSVNLTCDAVLNTFSANSSVIHSFTSKSAGSGSLIDSSPNEISFIDCMSGSREGLTFQFTDQLGRPLAIRDPDVNINVLIQIEDPNA